MRSCNCLALFAALTVGTAACDDSAGSPDTSVAPTTSTSETSADTSVAPDSAAPDSTTPDDASAPTTTVTDTAVDSAAPEDTSAPEDTNVVDSASPDDTSTPADTTLVAETTVATDIAPEVVSYPEWTLVVNELDCRGTPADWVEIVNTGTIDLALDRLWATDDVDSDHRTPLGVAGAVLAPGARLVVDLVGYGVACGQEGVSVVREDDVVLAEIPGGNNPSGYTFGRLPDISGAFTTTKATRGAVNAAPDLDPFDPISTLYDPLHTVPTIELTLSEGAYAQLERDRYTWVPATFTLKDDLGTFTQATAVRLKGKIGSYRELWQKAAWKIDFDHFHPGARFRGVEAMTLNNMVQDNAKTHEVLAYALFRAMGVPAPRAGYTWLRVNGEDFGFYLNLEAYDNPWFDNHLPTTKAMFEGEYGDDLEPGEGYYFDLDHGDEAGRLDLLALIDLLEATDTGPGFMDALAGVVDWGEMVAYFAVESFIGHWDGYGPTRNNYFLHVDDGGVFRMLPWGTDQTMESWLNMFDGQGRLFRGCMTDPACKDRYEVELMRLTGIVIGGDVFETYEGLAAHIQPFIDAEPREGGGIDVQNRWNAAVSFLEDRAQWVQDEIACQQDLSTDFDGDGFACSADCDESNPDAHEGGIEVCDDGIDQDCSGRADDGVNCPECSTRSHDGHTYLFCYESRNYSQAKDVCSGQGSRLLVINDSAENNWVAGQLQSSGLGSVWIGIDDIVQEGRYVWLDGRVWTDGGDVFDQFNGGEPNDYGAGEDCNQMFDNGYWNDIDCGSGQPVVCETP